MTALERAAEAAKQALLDDPETDAWVGGDDHFDALVVDGTIRLSPVVRAVLSAIREPNEGMQVAGVCESPYRWEEGRETVDAIWKAMIDSILRDQGGE